MKIVKIAEGAFFVPSYSEQTIAPAYSVGTTIQSLGSGDRVADEKHDGDTKPVAPPMGEGVEDNRVAATFRPLVSR